MSGILLGKLLCPTLEDVVARPRLLLTGQPHLLVAQAPAGFGKTTFLAQWAAACPTPVVFYRMDAGDRDGQVFAAHLAAGFRRHWPDWQPGPRAEGDPVALATELVNEAIGRPPIALVLDQLEAAFQQPYLSNFLELLLRYAPPAFTVALGTRAPLPVSVGLLGVSAHRVTAAELALTEEEAAAWLGPDSWQEPFREASGSPAALRFWKQHRPAWRTTLMTYQLSHMPPHIPADTARALVDAWLSGRLSLAEFAHQVSEGQPSSEKLWTEVHTARQMLLAGDCEAAQAWLERLWETARTSQNRNLMGAIALVLGERFYALGEFGVALDWFRRSLEADPALETTGSHSIVSILLEQGQLEEAARLAQRCLEARHHRGDLQARVFGHIAMTRVALATGDLGLAEANAKEAERLGLQLAGEPFYGIFAKALRASVLQRQGESAEARRLAEEAYALSRGRALFLQSICAMYLGPILIAWGETQAGFDRLQTALDAFIDRDAKWHAYCTLALFARDLWRAGERDRARERFDQCLSLAVSHGYLQHLLDPWTDSLPLVTDALRRGMQVTFCQELLLRMGDRALPALNELASDARPAVRRAVLYPLASLATPEALAIIRSALHDQHPEVQAAAIHAMQAAGLREEQSAAAPLAHEPAEAAAPLAISLLGPMNVACRGALVTSWRTAKTRDLLAYMALHAGRPVTRDQLLEALWPDSSLDGGQAVFHSTLYYLRRAIRPAGAEVISFAGGAYRLEPELVELDVDRFAAHASAKTEEGWRAAAALYRGDLLEGLDYPWCEAARTRTRGLYLQVLRSLALHLKGTGRVEEAITWLQVLVAEEPLNEETHVLLMECYAAIGNRNAALQQYRSMTQLLQEELGLEPGDAAQHVLRRLLG